MPGLPFEQPRRLDPAARPHASSLAKNAGSDQGWKQCTPSRVPVRRLVLSLIRTLRLAKSAKFHIAIAGLAIVAVTTAIGLAGASPASPAPQPASAGPASAGPTAPLTGSRPTALAVLAARRLLRGAPSQSAVPLGAVELDARTAESRAQPRQRAGGTTADPRQIAWGLLSAFHWRPALQFPYLNLLWGRESGWSVTACNTYSGAYGIPQALPAIKMASVGPDWQTDARTQILWGLRYIKARYGSPLLAWEHELAVGWY